MSAFEQDLSNSNLKNLEKTKRPEFSENITCQAVLCDRTRGSSYTGWKKLDCWFTQWDNKDASGYVRIWYYTGATPAERLLMTYHEETIRQTDDSVQGPPRTTYNQIISCACSPDGQRFITGGDDCHIRVYDLEGKGLLRTCNSSFTSDKVDGHVMRICALKYHPRGVEWPEYAHVFVSGGWDDAIHVWDDRHEHSLWIFGGPHICGSDALDIEPDSSDILSSSWKHDSTILQVWKISDKALPFILRRRSNESLSDGKDNAPLQFSQSLGGKPVAEIPQESIEMRSKGYVARWIGKQFIVFGGSGKNMLRIMSRAKPKAVASVNDLPGGVYSMAHLPVSRDDGKAVILAFASGSKVYISRLDPK